MTAGAPDTTDALRQVDECLPDALSELRHARAQLEVSPSGTSINRVEKAQQQLDGLLDQRLTLRRPA